MDMTEISLIHHIGLVLLLLWALTKLGWNHLIISFLSFLYLYMINQYYSLRLRKRIQFEERKNSNQRKLLSDTESVRWLNHAIEKMWPVCMQQIASQQFLLPIIPWFLDKFKPWTAQKAVMQHLYLGRNPPMFTEIRVLQHSANDDHLVHISFVICEVLELGMNFLSADDMSAILAVQLNKALGLGMTIKMHITSMHVEGKVLVGVKFLREWPFLERIRLCFVEPPYFQMTVKPIFQHGLDVTELPGISGWLDKLLDVAFSQTLVEPNMLVIDVKKFVAAPKDRWFTVKVKPSIGYVKLEIMEGAEMKPSDLNGRADPYVKGQLGVCKFRTEIQRKTLTPKWMQEFKIPITSWEAPNVLELHVHDKDPMFDDFLGKCSVNVNDYNNGQRHDMWLTLQDIKMGRIHIAITLIEEPEGNEDTDDEKETSNIMDPSTTVYDEKVEDYSDQRSQRMSDEYEPIDIKGQETTGIWVHRPGSDVSQTWEYRKGRAHQPSVNVSQEDSVYSRSSSSKSESQVSESNSNKEGKDAKKGRLNSKKIGLGKLGSIFHKRTGSNGECKEEVSPSPHPTPHSTPRPNLHQIGDKQTHVNLIMDDSLNDKIAEPLIQGKEVPKDL